MFSSLLSPTGFVWTQTSSWSLKKTSVETYFIANGYIDILTFKLRKNEIEILLFSAGLNLAYRFFFQKKVAILA